MIKKAENLVDEGLRVSLVEKAFFGGDLEIPHINAPKDIITPDCSLYVDAPLCVQITDIYLSRAVGYYLQSQGLYVIPNIRWGDERTFTTEVFNQKAAFLGVDKHSPVSIGTYGQIKTAEAKRLFRDGLIAMLDELEPKVVIVYGSMPDSNFHGLSERSRFFCYPDWITRMKKDVSFHDIVKAS